MRSITILMVYPIGKSPLSVRHFDFLYQCTLVLISEVDKISQSDSNSVSYNH